jgi:hypothetical protein
MRIPLRTQFATLGTTTLPYFVDRTRQLGTRYAYQVVAETPSGGVSVPSNVQIVPDPRPPATLRRLRAAGLTSRAVARMAASHGGARGRSLARLARTAPDDRVRQLALRLERRLRYERVAGGPVKGG